MTALRSWARCGLAIFLLAAAPLACSKDETGGGGGGSGAGGEGGEGGDEGAENPGPPPEIDCEPLPGAEFPEVSGRNDLDAGYFAAPWPDDSRMGPGGNIDVAGFPNPADVDFLRNYLTIIGQNTDGWGANSAIYLPFDGPIHPDSLPEGPEATLGPHSTVFLQAADDSSDRAPIEIRWQEAATPFLPGNVLILRPVLGHVLRGATTYRAVATDRLLDAACRPLEAGAEAVFTTQEIIGPMERMREVVHELPAPRFAGLRQQGSYRDVFVYEGTVEIPIFQVGDPPYAAEGGVIEWDGDGRPVLQYMQAVRVALAVPRTDAPRGGWPLVIYSHGTGTTADYLTFVKNGPAAQMAQRGLASLGFDQVVHGERVPPGSLDPQLAFVNLSNILAARDNMRQGAADGFQLMRLATQEGGIIVKLDLTFTHNRTFTDPLRVMFLGHSQGAITGAPFVALEPELRGAVFSGAGGILSVTLYERKVPVNFHELAKQFLGLNSLDVDVQLDLFHPVSSLIQTFIEPADSVNYAPYFLLKNTQTKTWPTSTFVIQGLEDEAVVPNSGAAFIAATGVDLAKPAPMPIEAMELRGQPPEALPFENNINGVTAGAVQYEAEGHFALFKNEGAQQKAYRFLKSAAEDRAIIAR